MSFSASSILNGFAVSLAVHEGGTGVSDRLVAKRVWKLALLCLTTSGGTAEQLITVIP